MGVTLKMNLTNTASTQALVWIDEMYSNKGHCTVSLNSLKLQQQPGSTAVTNWRSLLSRLCCLSAVGMCW